DRGRGAARRVDGNAERLGEVERRARVVGVLVRHEDGGDRLERQPARGEPPARLAARQARVEEHGRLLRADDRAVAGGAGAEERDLDHPVLPNPPAPRALGASSGAATNSARATGAMTSCATRSPRESVTGSLPRFTIST